jgi:hypothetical protein
VLRAELAVVRERYNGVRLHAGIGHVTPNDEHEGRGPAIRKARQAGPELARLQRLPGTASTVSLNHPRNPAMVADRSAISIANPETGHGGAVQGHDGAVQADGQAHTDQHGGDWASSRPARSAGCFPAQASDHTESPAGLHRGDSRRPTGSTNRLINP